MSDLSFTEYQRWASTTSIYPDTWRVIYPTLGLTGEAGEVAEKVKKMLRDDDGQLTEERRQAIVKEIGDVLWYIAALCSDLHIDMGDVARANLVKLLSRKEKGTLQGSGDDR